MQEAHQSAGGGLCRTPQVCPQKEHGNTDTYTDATSEHSNMHRNSMIKNERENLQAEKGFNSGSVIVTNGRKRCIIER